MWFIGEEDAHLHTPSPDMLDTHRPGLPMPWWWYSIEVIPSNLKPSKRYSSIHQRRFDNRNRSTSQLEKQTQAGTHTHTHTETHTETHTQRHTHRDTHTETHTETHTHRHRDTHTHSQIAMKQWFMRCSIYNKLMIKNWMGIKCPLHMYLFVWFSCLHSQHSPIKKPPKYQLYMNYKDKRSEN